MSDLGDTVEVYSFSGDPPAKDPNTKLDWVYLVGSLVKLIETGIMWKLGAGILVWSSSLPWFYFFTCAVILQQRELSRGYHKNLNTGEVDILAGDLPTILKGGGKRQIILGALRNFRHHRLWIVVWVLGSVVCTTSLILSYAVLGRQEGRVVYTWLVLQAVWLLLRSAYFQIAEATDTIKLAFRKENNMNALPENSDLMDRVLGLMFALAKQGANIHPRGSRWYEEETLSADKLSNVLSRRGHTIQNAILIPPGLQTGSNIQLEVLAIVGDCLLGAAAWLQGLKLAGLEPEDRKENAGLHLYDSCIVTIRLNTLVVSVPVTRALCTPTTPNQNVSQAESGTANRGANVPRGTPGISLDIMLWYYWIPCTDGRWLQVCSAGTKMLATGRLQSKQTLISKISLIAGI